MRRLPLIAVLLAASILSAQDRKSPPKEFIVGVRTYFDFGPPFNYYDVFVVRPERSGSSIERITVTPGMDECFGPPKIEAATASVHQSVTELLDLRNPCLIPEKALKKELKRCKNCVNFSGANVALSVRCGGEDRLIRSAVLDQDWFDAHVKTPDNTSWTMALVRRLNEAVGPGVMEKPMLQTVSDGTTTIPSDDAINNLAVGRYDPLFDHAPDRVSELYQHSKQPLPVPTVVLSEVTPARPLNLVDLSYPPMARLVHVQGPVRFRAEIDPDGKVSDITATYGHPMIASAVKDAVSKWVFPKGEAPRTVQGTFTFSLNCAEVDK